MIQLTSCEIDDLGHCKRELEVALGMLDAVGAGIAAIHVNAAIEQIKSNLAAIESVEDEAGGIFFVKEDVG